MAFLHGRIDYERAAAEKMTAYDFKLDRMRELLALLGDPQETIPAVHITGTKGKGSTAVMAAEMLTAAGYRTGLFTSPHISVFEERMRVDGRPPDERRSADLLEDVAAAVLQLDVQGPAMRPTYFEIATAMAWLYFRRERCDFVVLEVGLGGRLDSTNLCRPEVTVITNVSRDHTNVLGETVQEIAAEKAGILKPNVPVVCGVVDPDVVTLIRRRAEELDAKLLQRGRDFDDVYRRPVTIQSARVDSPSAPGESPGANYLVDVRTPYSRFSSLPLRLAGAFQGKNAAAAVTAVDVLRNRGFSISDEAIVAGMNNVHWPLRLEVLRTDPLVIVDAAHNEAAAAALVTALRTEFPAGRRTLIFAASRDKPVERIAAELFPAFDAVVLTQFVANPRAIPPEQLAARIASAGNSPRMLTAADPSAACSLALKSAGDGDLICATGSFYLAAEVRQILQGESPAVSPTAIVPALM